MPFGVLVAVDAQPGGVGEVGAELEEERSKIIIDAVEVVVADHRSGRHDPRIRHAGGRVVPAFGAEYVRLLLGDPDEHDLVGAGKPGQVLMHHVVLALPFGEVHQRDSPVGGIGLDVGDELP